MLHCRANSKARAAVPQESVKRPRGPPQYAGSTSTQYALPAIRHCLHCFLTRAKSPVTSKSAFFNIAVPSAYIVTHTLSGKERCYSLHENKNTRAVCQRFRAVFHAKRKEGKKRRLVIAWHCVLDAGGCYGKTIDKVGVGRRGVSGRKNLVNFCQETRAHDIGQKNPRHRSVRQKRIVTHRHVTKPIFHMPKSIFHVLKSIFHVPKSIFYRLDTGEHWRSYIGRSHEKTGKVKSSLVGL